MQCEGNHECSVHHHTSKKFHQKLFGLIDMVHVECGVYGVLCIVYGFYVMCVAYAIEIPNISQAINPKMLKYNEIEWN